MYPSPMHYGNPDMQASRHGHMYSFIQAGECMHTRVCSRRKRNKRTSTADGLQCQLALRPSFIIR